MDARYVDGSYLASNPTWDEEDSHWKAEQIHTLLYRNRIDPSSIVDLGCGAGGVLASLHGMYPRARLYGFDLSPQAIAMAKRHAGTAIQFSASDPLSDPERFDVLIAADVFEHVPDYLGFLAKCQRKASYKVYHVPLDMHVSAILRDAHIRQRNNVGHLHYFTASSALATLRDTGHEVIDHFYTCGALDLFRTHPSLRRALANLPRLVLSKFSIPLTAKLLGGYSLIALCR